MYQFPHHNLHMVVIYASVTLLESTRKKRFTQIKTFWFLGSIVNFESPPRFDLREQVARYFNFYTIIRYVYYCYLNYKSALFQNRSKLCRVNHGHDVTKPRKMFQQLSYFVCEWNRKVASALWSSLKLSWTIKWPLVYYCNNSRNSFE
jgi:hypothetical protein